MTALALHWLQKVRVSTLRDRRARSFVVSSVISASLGFFCVGVVDQDLNEISLDSFLRSSGRNRERVSDINSGWV